MFTNNECCDFDIFIDQSKKDRLVEAGVNYVIVNPDSVTDLWLEDEYGNERRLSDISYYYKTMLVAGEDFDVIELVDYIPQRIVDAMYEGSTAFSGYSGVIMWIGEEYTDHSDGTRYTVSPDLEIMSVVDVKLINA